MSSSQIEQTNVFWRILTAQINHHHCASRQVLFGIDANIDLDMSESIENPQLKVLRSVNDARAFKDYYHIRIFGCPPTAPQAQFLNRALKVYGVNEAPEDLRLMHNQHMFCLDLDDACRIHRMDCYIHKAFRLKTQAKMNVEAFICDRPKFHNVWVKFNDHLNHWHQHHQRLLSITNQSNETPERKVAFGRLVSSNWSHFKMPIKELQKVMMHITPYKPGGKD